MSKGRVLFVEPMGAQSNVFSKYMTIPLLGPVYLATIAKKAGYSVSILNENIIGRQVSNYELRYTDVLCVSCITATVEQGKAISKRYRLERKNFGAPALSMIGGIHATMLPDDVTDHFDQVICGEAETIFSDLLDRKLTTPVVNGERIQNLDIVPIPDFSLVEGYQKINTWPVMTSRGCPHLCNFCSVSLMFGRNYRHQSTDRVIEELHQYKKGWLFFVDDNFTVNTHRSRLLLDNMLKIKYRRPWTAQVRTETAKDPELVQLMRHAGCRIVYIGLESINPDSLKKMEKRQTIDDIRQSIKVFQKSGIQVHGMFMLGHDQDTKAIFPATSDFCKKNRINFVQYSILTPLPGTEVYKNFEKEDRLLHKNWQHYDGLHVVFKPLNMSAEELQRGMITCYKSFYSIRNALNDVLLSLKNQLIQTQKHFFTEISYLHSYYPALMKWLGKHILRKWVKENQQYLAYLKSIRTER